MRIDIPEREVYIEINEQESEELGSCPLCQGSAERKTAEGYSSSADLNRPSGAKGRDETHSSVLCLSCGHKMGYYEWPFMKIWVAEIYDLYGNYLCRGSSEIKEEAILEVASLYEEIQNDCWVGDY